MDERTKLIGEYLSGGYSISELARRRGISRKTAFKWIERYEQEGLEGLKEQSRAPQHQARAISEQMEPTDLGAQSPVAQLGSP